MLSVGRLYQLLAATVRAQGNKDEWITPIVTLEGYLFSLALQRRTSRVDQIYRVRIHPAFKHGGGYNISALDHPAVDVMAVHCHQRRIYDEWPRR